tara:strand:+ start:1123 stop:1320 length:198 start_codon:yes stop_codon:yes gene_type:complete
LTVNELQLFFLKRKKRLAVIPNPVILYIMKVKELKIRKPILFTKARPFKMKNKILPRKQKHKEQL